MGRRSGKMIGMLPISGEVWTGDAEMPPTLEWAQAFVGGGNGPGLVQVVHIHVDGEPAQMLINENAKIDGMPMNQPASSLWIAEQQRCAGRTLSVDEVDLICGPALVLTGAAMWT